MSPFRVTLVVTALALSSPFAQHRGDVVDLIRLVPRAFAFPYCCCCYLSLLCLRVAGSRVPNERRGSSCRAVVLLAFRVLRWLAEYSLQRVRFRGAHLLSLHPGSRAVAAPIVPRISCQPPTERAGKRCIAGCLTLLCV